MCVLGAVIENIVQDRGGGGATFTMSVPSSVVGAVIGRGGETIRVIEQRSGANISIEKDTDAEPGSTERLVFITGDSMAIETARQCKLRSAVVYLLLCTSRA
jgi:far upstream element-binding protein